MLLGRDQCTTIDFSIQTLFTLNIWNFKQLVKQNENTHPTSYLFMTTTEEPEQGSSITKGAQSKQCKFTEKRNTITVTITALFPSHSPTLYFKASLKNFPHYLHMILYLHYSP